MRRFIVMLAACVCSTPFLSPSQTTRQETLERPDVILVVIDALRADRLGSYGNPDGHSPVIDRFAQEGTVFEAAIAQAPWTQPSIASLFCSQYPGVHQVLDYNGMIDSVYYGAKKVAVFDDSFITLAEALKAHGYETAAFVANPFVLKEYGFAQGFDYFDSSFAKTSAPGNVVNEAALSWLDKRESDRPLFLYLHYMDVHGPYNASPEILDPLLDKVEAIPDKVRLDKEALRKLDYLRRPPAEQRNPERHVRLMRYREYWEARYSACVREMDRYFSALLDGLNAQGIGEEALAIVTADHGEELYEHGYWDHGNTLHHTELHVPLLIRWGNHVEPKTRVQQRVRLFDLMPTLLEVLEIPHRLQMQGESFAPLLDRSEGGDDRMAFAEGVKLGPEQKALYLGKWKAIQQLESEEARLFNIKEDPYEKRDWSQAHPELVEERIELIKEQVSENEDLSSGLEVERIEVDPDAVDRFKSLGYLR